MENVYGILHKTYYKMLGVRIDKQIENTCVELDIDVGNVWTTESADAARLIIDNPASWFDSTMEKPRHQFKPEELVIIELCDRKGHPLYANAGGKSDAYATGIVTSIEMNTNTVLNFPKTKMIIECDNIVNPRKFTDTKNFGRVIVLPVEH